MIRRQLDSVGSDPLFAQRIHASYWGHQGMVGGFVASSHPIINPGQGANQNWVFHFQGLSNFGQTTVRQAPLYQRFGIGQPCNLERGPFIQYFSPIINTGGANYLQTPFASLGAGYDSSIFNIFQYKQDSLLWYFQSYPSVSSSLNLSMRPLPHMWEGMRLGDEKVTHGGSPFYMCSGWPPADTNYFSAIDTVRYSGYGSLSVNGAPATEAILIEHRLYIDNFPRSTAPSIRRRWFSFLSASTGDLLLNYMVIPQNRTSSDQLMYAYWNASRFPAASPMVTRPAAPRWSLGPNPVSSTLTIRGLRSGTVAITNSQGQRWQLSSRDGRVDVSALAPGVYVLEAEGERARFVKE